MNKILLKIILTLQLAIVSVLIINFKNFNSNVYADEINNENIQSISIVGDSRSEKECVIYGEYTADIEFNDLTNQYLIPNANYFLISPSQHDNGPNSISIAGECSSVALQMLMGYYNYYEDRRIIPSKCSGKTYLDSTYGEYSMNPIFQRERVGEEGCKSIGTSEGFFEELYSESSTLGLSIEQILPITVLACDNFINSHSSLSLSEKNQVDIDFHIYSESEAKSYLNNGKPIVLGLSSISGTEVSFHVVVAYGYAKLDGVDGYLVHYGWRDRKTMVWIPESWFRFAVTMDVNTHTHDFTQETIIDNYYIGVKCSTCKATCVDIMYSVTNGQIKNTRYQLSGVINVPNNISVYNVYTGEDFSMDIISLGDNAFSNQSGVTSIVLPKTITSIGEQCFLNCENLTAIFAQNTKITSIEKGAFATLTNTVVYLPNNITYIDDSSLIFTQPRKLNLSGFDMSKVTYIGDSAFYGSLVKDVVFSSSLTYIADHAFRSSNLKGIVYLPSNINYIGSHVFADTDVTCFYTEKSPNNNGWYSNWNNSITTVYDCTFSSDKSYVISLNKTSSSLAHVTSSGIINPTREDYTFSGWYEDADYSGTQYTDLTLAPNGILYAKWEAKSSSCITEGTKVTLSNGTQVNVENLTGTESLLAWDMFNGCFVSAPILFIDRENIDTYNVINLTFSDGTITKVVSDHGFFDVTLCRYVYITEDTAYDYIGHSFNKGNTNVSLVSVNIQEEYTRVYSPVTYGYLCYYTNGMLSMPGNTEIFANIFSIDSETLRYTNVDEDIENYGLYTYEEFNNLIEIDEYVFNAFNGEYLKIAIGKGMTNLNEIQALLDRYSVFFE
jgi:uncharacterized repeat protein (TIGR02543 family)